MSPEPPQEPQAPPQDEVDRLMLPYRDQIDRIDREILALLGERQRVIAEVAAFKRRTGIPNMQYERIRRQLEARRRWAAEEGLDPDVVAGFFERLISYHSAVEGERMGEPGGASGG